MKEYFDSKIPGKKVIILGMGVEGKSTYRFLRRLYPRVPLTIADRREDISNDPELKHPETLIRSGPGYLDGIHDYDLVIKSPGIPLDNMGIGIDPDSLTSQTSMFLEIHRDRTIGITGTKGKSTTASLISHLLSATGKNVLLVGNIGIPPFDVLDRIHHDTTIVFELSAHQLEGVRISPHISILLNIYQEHLDHYRDFRAYGLAKLNIGRWQHRGDFFIYHKNDPVVTKMLEEFPLLSSLLSFAPSAERGAYSYISGNEIFINSSGVLNKICDLTGRQILPGRHNNMNLLAALTACYIHGSHGLKLCTAIDSFRGLEHRMEFIGEFRGVKYYNDSIATIPEAVIYALETIGDVDTLLLGGFDRGIDYSALTTHLGSADIRNIFLTGEAGRRVKRELEEGYPGRQNVVWFEDFDIMVARAIDMTPPGKSCLLSPAAASYDQFRNFEHRGNRFKELVRNHYG